MPLMIRQILGIAFFLAFVWVADWAVTHAGLPVPAAVVAMALLTVGLAAQKRVPPTLDAGAALLFRHFPLFFIPALTGILAVAEKALANWVAILCAISLSTFLGLGVTAALYRALTSRGQGGRR